MALENNLHLIIEKPDGSDKIWNGGSVVQISSKRQACFLCYAKQVQPLLLFGVKEMMESGKLGKIQMVQINCFWNRDERYYSKSNWKGKLNLDGGPLFTQFSHFIDIMYWLFGDIEDISAKFEKFSHNTNTEFEDSGLINFKFHNGGMGTINYSTSVWDKNFEKHNYYPFGKGDCKNRRTIHGKS